MNFNLQKKSLLYLLIGVTLITVFITFSSESKFKTEIPFSQVVKMAKKRVFFQGNLYAIFFTQNRYSERPWLATTPQP